MKVVDWIKLAFDPKEDFPSVLARKNKEGIYESKDEFGVWHKECQEPCEKMDRAVIDAIKEKRIWQSGYWHQYHDGTPVFEDGTITTYSMRYWGELVATAWNELLGEERYNYIDFAWHVNEDEEPTIEDNREK